MAQLRLLAPAAPDLPGDADLMPALPGAGMTPGQWVNASGRSAADAGAVLAAHDSLLAHGAAHVVLFGESAGGTLVLSALLALKAAGFPLPRAVAVSPLTDLTLSSPSLDTNDGLDLINRAVLEQIVAQYLAGARPDRVPQSPLHGDLTGLPPLLLAAGSREVLLDDAARFADAAQDATLDVYEGMPHVFHLALLTGVPHPTTTTFLRRLADFTHGRPI